MLSHHQEILFKRSCDFKNKKTDTIDSSYHYSSNDRQVKCILVEPEPLLARWILSLLKHTLFPSNGLELSLGPLNSPISVIVRQAEAMHESLSLLHWLLIVFINELYF